MIEGSPGRALSNFTVELDVYSGPYEWLLALILKDEVDIFEVPLKELISLYLQARDLASPDALERDTDFASSASSLILLKSRTLSPLLDPEPDEEDAISPEELAERLSFYLKVRRGAEALKKRFEENAGHFSSGHELKPRPGKLRIDPKRVMLSAKRVFSRLEEPSVRHLGPITVTIQQLAALIRGSLARGPISYEELTRDMDRLHSAVTFAAALSLAHEDRLKLLQSEPLGPLTLEPST
ncbi:MAG: segregation and condensation protein A [Rubrobacteraceae bacterium]